MTRTRSDGNHGTEGEWRSLIDAVRGAGHQLDAAAYGQVWELFQRCTIDRAVLDALRRSAPEYGGAEYLASVDGEGQVIRVASNLLARFEEQASRYPEFGLWFREAVPVPQEGRTLLIARWLCHLAGFRHQTVHLFLDHSSLPDHTLVQVRGLSRADAPGCYDLPVAGHVEGLASVEETLFKELEEELGLAPASVAGLRALGQHEQRTLGAPCRFNNVEYAHVFCGRLTQEGWLRASAASPEVAALALFHLDDLEDALARTPERFACGLSGSYPLYAEAATVGRC
ncbi:MAG: NUDIX domain-containing protein [Anaerolineae bacterium]|nr:NUDIX domain-containing protein [Anaerolineae bacterium]